MRGEPERQMAILTTLTTEDLIPADHPIRRIGVAVARRPYSTSLPHAGNLPGLAALGSLCNHVARIGVGGSPATPLPSTHFESTLAVGFNYVNIAADNDLTV